MYKISQTLAGGDNNTSGDAVSDVDLYISVDGWRLNATANQSYMSKQLDAGWATTAPFAGWNIPDDWRSFWGKAYTYGADLEGKLFYETPKNLTANPFGFDGTNQGNVQYCYENTNSPDDIFTDVNVGMEFGDRTVAVQTSKVTHVALLTNIRQPQLLALYRLLDRSYYRHHHRKLENSIVRRLRNGSRRIGRTQGRPG